MTYLAYFGIAVLIWLVLVLLFSPCIPYHIREPLSLSDPELLRTLEATTQARLFAGNHVEVLVNGERFYPAMEELIRSARTSVNMEVYIWQPGEIASRLEQALVERARAGVAVHLIVDAVGSAGLRRAYSRRMSEAGIKVSRYRRLTWHDFHRVNNRTHREILVVDGHSAIVGGPGVADWWYKPHRKKPAWRDTAFRVRGPVVADLQGTFAENWLECCGEILAGPRYFPEIPPAGASIGLVVKSSPSDRATAGRALFQLLIHSAEKSLQITTPYFLPDAALRKELAAAARRGVAINIVVPGPFTDQRWVRLASRRMYRHLLSAGIKVFEYLPAMLHAKTMIVDGRVAVVGTTNIDNRSFEHNDEVNLLVVDPEVAGVLAAQFAVDLAASEAVTLRRWHGRAWWERALSPVVWLLERQQ